MTMLKGTPGVKMGLLIIAAVLMGLCPFLSDVQADQHGSLAFDPGAYVSDSIAYNGNTIEYRAYEGVVYVSQPVDLTYHVMNVFVPEAYYHDGGAVNGYTADTAPIWFKNDVGGWRPSVPKTPKDEGVEHMHLALSRGYVVVSPGVRGFTLQDENGKNYGMNPHNIADLKAALRYLHYHDAVMPGDANKIIASGTSAGGALTALMGTSGNSKDYEPYLRLIGALDARDDVYAAAPYCPITNLENSDTAYEWQFRGLIEYAGAGYPAGTLTWEEWGHSNYLAAMFPAYLNSLEIGLTLDPYGNGSFKDFITAMLIESAQQGLDRKSEGMHVRVMDAEGKPESVLKPWSESAWITIENGQVVDFDFAGYIAEIGRMKKAPSHSYVVPNNGGQYAFGNEDQVGSYYTEYSYLHRTDDSFPRTDPLIVKMMNPMRYIADPESDTAQYWRIRHGARDWDTSFPIAAMLAKVLEKDGKSVDLFFPWDVGHAGHYDLEELFEWLDMVGKK